jgi:hypothetical protein
VEAMQAKVLTAHEARRIAVNNCEVAGAAWEERTCGLSSRARRNLHRFRAGTTAGREIGDRAKIPARDYARIAHQPTKLDDQNHQHEQFRLPSRSTRRDGTDPRRRASRWCGSGSCRDHGGRGFWTNGTGTFVRSLPEISRYVRVGHQPLGAAGRRST